MNREVRITVTGSSEGGLQDQGGLGARWLGEREKGLNWTDALGDKRAWTLSRCDSFFFFSCMESKELQRLFDYSVFSVHKTAC